MKKINIFFSVSFFVFFVSSNTFAFQVDITDDLEYLWIQLDQNVRAQESLSKRTKSGSLRETYEISQFKIDYRGTGRKKMQMIPGEYYSSETIDNL